MAVSLDAWLGYLTLPIRYGFVGRVLLFAISGYGIHRSLARRLAAGDPYRPNWGRFVVHRLWKIYPVYAAALLLTALLDGLVERRAPGSMAAYDHSPWALAVNLLALQGWLAPQFGSNYPLWALAVILHIYLAYPLLYALTVRWGAGAVLALTLCAGLAYTTATHATGLSAPYPLAHGPVFLPHWFAWAVGLYVAEAEYGRAPVPGRRWALLLVPVAAATVYLDECGLQDYAEVGFAVLCGALLYWSIGPAGRTFWSGRAGWVLAGVGVVGFALFAVHVPCLHLVSALLDPPGQRFESLLPTLLACGAALAAAYLVYELVERRMKDTIGRYAGEGFRRVRATGGSRLTGRLSRLAGRARWARGRHTG